MYLHPSTSMTSSIHPYSFSTQSPSSPCVPFKCSLFLPCPALLTGAFNLLPCLCQGLTFHRYVLLHQLTMDSLTLYSKSLRSWFGLGRFTRSFPCHHGLGDYLSFNIISGLPTTFISPANQNISFSFSVRKLKKFLMHVQLIYLSSSLQGGVVLCLFAGVFCKI